MPIEIDIIICTEPGELESKSLMLINSIRKWGGELKNANIYSYSPRNLGELHYKTIQYFQDYSVNFNNEILNNEFQNYPLANKPIVCSYHEMNSKADLIIFIDSDSFFLEAPWTIPKLLHGQISLRPVDVINIGADINLSNANGAYWQSIYSLLGVEPHRTVNSTICNSEIFEYYNSGFIISTQSNGLFQRWKSNFIDVMRLGHEPTNGTFFIEQSVLSATISSMNLDVIPLSKYLNVPVHIKRKFSNFTYQIDDVNQISHLHYHDVFSREEKFQIFEKIFSSHSQIDLIINDLKKFDFLDFTRRH